MNNLIMFDHTRYTKFAVWLMAIHSLIGSVVAITTIAAVRTIDTTTSTDVSDLATLFCLVLVNTLLCLCVYRKSLLALQFSPWLYALQSVGFETKGYSLQLNSGLHLTVSLPINHGSLSVNFAVLGIWIVLLKAISSINEQRKQDTE